VSVKKRVLLALLLIRYTLSFGEVNGCSYDLANIFKGWIVIWLIECKMSSLNKMSQNFKVTIDCAFD